MSDQNNTQTADTNSQQYTFDSQEEFLEKLTEMTASGIKPESISCLTPFHVHEVDHILKSKTSALRFFSLVGALAGFFISFAFILFTVFDWPSPMITGGKPLASYPVFIVVAFECTILIGGIVSFLGFLHLSRLPDIKGIIAPRDCGNQFIIIHKTEVVR